MDQLANLPPLAVVVFGATLALIFGVRYLGLLSGAGAPSEKSQSTAQVAAVIVDPSALNKLSAAGEALNMTIMESNQIAKEKTRVEKQLAEELDNIREELRIQREISRRERDRDR
ncbi:hypothetical protein LAV84_04945 [Rhizobium sp. VS19-DR104.2]|uniref:hypothetical protein n=1 Tax=unclassified Rhizobium TaxID=2613769 RepID=UPI001CC54503|nr:MULTISPECIES: hypothetical protein [unclassified Rhizobium]MBZ5757970.1 hypothetical protein [Rhizobium sp. VS19-DR96]MBZ5765200.1 hypothetical protein [Rhizobium sp. VS19-DR129.2]MBZ5772743.1 hypothetical protein [Rhizobium sp. VS19-DRK62.2]MBZ5782570.1 hypothetical protein [Rhizobium sp. VS19-DR121]MBZ5800018.1 hypothetical protein [Rhizobium sp. VS19-DR181]